MVIEINNYKGCVYWVCKDSRRNAKCQSRCITDEQLNKLIKLPGEHNHEPSQYPKPKKSKPKENTRE